MLKVVQQILHILYLEFERVIYLQKIVCKKAAKIDQ